MRLNFAVKSCLPFTWRRSHRVKNGYSHFATMVSASTRSTRSGSSSFFNACIPKRNIRGRESGLRSAEKLLNGTAGGTRRKETPKEINSHECLRRLHSGTSSGGQSGRCSIDEGSVEGRQTAESVDGR